MSHSTISKGLVTNKGQVLTDGTAGNLGKGQLAFVLDKAGQGGAKVVSNFAGLNNKERIAIRLGRNPLPSGLRDQHAPYYQTDFFSLNSIVDIKAHASKTTEFTFDSFLAGYDGINNSTALFIPEGKAGTFDFVLYGKPIEIEFGEKEHLVSVKVQRQVGETMQEVIVRLVDELNNTTVPRSRKKVSEYVTIDVVDSSNLALAGTANVFSTLTIADEGDSNALGLVQASYPDYKVVKTGVAVDGKSIYTILHPSTDSLANFSQVTTITDGKGCEDCLAGYTAIDAGYVYHVTSPTDAETAIQALTGYVDHTVVGTADQGVISYSVVLNQEIVATEKASLISGADGLTILFKGTTEEVCTKTSTVTTAWVDSQTCYASQKAFSIQLPDNDCGDSRLAELQANYPELTIVEGVYNGNSTRTATISGSSGSMGLVVGGTSYTTPYNTSVAQTASDFVTSHADAIETATGAVVTSAGAVITFTAPTATFPTITAVASGLTETLGTVTRVVVASEGGCARKYATLVTTNIVCSECDNIFLQKFVAETPTEFQGIAWEESVTVFDEDAKMGIRITGKPYLLYPENYASDQIPFIETSTKIRSVAGGYRENDYVNFNISNAGSSTILPGYDASTELFKVKRLSRAQDRKNLSHMLRGMEEVSRAHYLGEKREFNNLFARTNLGEETLLDYNKRVITYHIVYQDTKLSQSAGGRSNITHEIPIVVLEGYHQGIEDIVNNLASKVGLDTVNPTGN